MYKYFVSFNMSANELGVCYGNCEATKDKPYTYEDIKILQEQIEEKMGFPKGSVMVLNFILLDKTADETESKA